MSAPPLLVCEALGFVPQLLLDDIVNVANQTIQNAVNDIEEHLLSWAERRAKQPDSDKDGTEEVEQGLVAFQTLLEYHTDLGFDYLEAWSLRNAFNIPADLPIVLPHHEGLDLAAPPERERELMDEIDSLLKKIDAVCSDMYPTKVVLICHGLRQQRRLELALKRALRTSSNQRRTAENKHEQLAAIVDHPSFEELSSLPQKYEAMYNACSSLEPLDAATLSALTQVELSEPGKHPWESTKSGYIKWAKERLAVKAGGLVNEVTTLADHTSEIGSTEKLRRALETTQDVRLSLGDMAVDGE